MKDFEMGVYLFNSKGTDEFKVVKGSASNEIQNSLEID